MNVVGQVACDVQYPTSSGTFNKEPDYILNLQQDLDRLIQEEFLERSHTPSYVARLGQEVGPSRECFLFTRKLLAPSKVEQQFEKSSPPRPTTAPPPSARTRFVKTNDRHQFLTATEIKGSDTEARYGRPTRTSILRARHRINSAPPVTSMEEKCSQRGVLSDRPPSKYSKRPTSAASIASTVDSVQEEMMRSKGGVEGETVHQFLVGARYNTAHYVDRKAIERYGVYMPRSSPGQFFTKSEATRNTTPRSRPASPVEAWNISTRPTSASSTIIGALSTARPPTPAADDSVLATLAGHENVPEVTSLSTPPQEPLSVRGSRISPTKPSINPSTTPLGSVASGIDRRASPRVAQSTRAASPLPHVVGLSLGAASPGGRIPATMRTRRVIVAARFGGSTVGSASAAAQRRSGGVAASDIARAFSVRPWRDARSLRQAIIERSKIEKAVEVPVLSLEEEALPESLPVHIEDLESPKM